jgi:hypothetical protein
MGSTVQRENRLPLALPRCCPLAFTVDDEQRIFTRLSLQADPTSFWSTLSAGVEIRCVGRHSLGPVPTCLTVSSSNQSPRETKGVRQKKTDRNPKKYLPTHSAYDGPRHGHGGRAGGAGGQDRRAGGAAGCWSSVGSAGGLRGGASGVSGWRSDAGSGPARGGGGGATMAGSAGGGREAAASRRGDSVSRRPDARAKRRRADDDTDAGERTKALAWRRPSAGMARCGGGGGWPSPLASSSCSPCTPRRLPNPLSCFSSPTPPPLHSPPLAPYLSLTLSH